MSLDADTNALPGTITIDVGGDERGGGNYPAVDAGRPCTCTWEELMGQTGGVALTDVSRVGAGDKTLTVGTTKIKNALCDIEVEGSQGSQIARVTLTGCVDATA